ASLLGGRIWVESALGAGSSFYFLVPRFYRPGTGLRAGRGPRESPRDGAARREAEIDADIAAEKPALLVLADAEAHRSGVEALFEGSDFAPVSATAVEITCEYLETLRPSAAVVVTESERRADSRALQAIRTSGIPVVEVDAGALERRGERSGALDSAVATAVYRAVIGSDLGCVLLVDDDAHFAEILRKLVEPYCREAIAVEDPELALERVRAGEADALILDLMMPGLDGFTFLTLVRQDERTRRVPILVCSSKTPSGEERSLLRDLGAGFLPKDALAGSRLAEGLMEARARAPKTKGRAARASSE
ncbi:MAG TPA: response regulator, partial [Gammaproteobacteria bacterium]|nr:response regulator [Gammaproteobacteria bacterium]